MSTEEFQVVARFPTYKMPSLKLLVLGGREVRVGVKDGENRDEDDQVDVCCYHIQS